MIVWQHPLFSTIGRKLRNWQLENQGAVSGVLLDLLHYISFVFSRQFVHRATIIYSVGIEQLIVEAEHDQQNKSQIQKDPSAWGNLLHASLPPPSQSCDGEKCDKNRKA